MKNKAIAFLAIPTMVLLSSFNFANADDTNATKTDGAKHQSEKGGKHRGPSIEKKVQKLTNVLELSEAQQTQITTLFEKQKTAHKAGAEQRKSLHEAIRAIDVNAADYTAKLAQVKQQAGLQAQNKVENMLTAKQEMQQILTPEQFSKFEEMKAKMKMKKGQKHDKQEKN
jgi:Spy/CpxP family protein refolding chaperone